MSTPVVFEGAYPIGDASDTNALPVKELGPAIGYYALVLGFTLQSQTETTALLRRDAATIGLVQSDADPEQVSVYFAVQNVDALHAELSAKHIAPSSLRPDAWDGKNRRIFFAKEPYGVCFCFGQAV